MYEPRFRITSRLLNLISQAAELRAWIAQAAVDVPWLPSLQKDTAARLAHSSTAIEGNPLSLSQVQSLVQGDQVFAQEKSKKEVLDYLRALKWIEREPPGSLIAEKKLLHLHKLVTQNTLPKQETGRYKTRPNRIVDSRGRTVYLPPSPGEVKKLTRELLTWINQSSKSNIHPHIVSAVAHHRLVSIHPFMDGNGRVSRTLALWVLYIRRFDTQHLFALDEFFEADRARYYDKIQQVRELDQDMTYWLEYAADGLIHALEKTKDRIHSLQIRNKDSRLRLSERQEQVLRLIREHGKVKSADIRKAFDLTRSRVNQVVKPLVSAGVLIQEGATRSTTYRIA